MFRFFVVHFDSVNRAKIADIIIVTFHIPFCISSLISPFSVNLAVQSTFILPVHTSQLSEPVISLYIANDLRGTFLQLL